MYLCYFPNLFCTMGCKWCVQEVNNPEVRRIKDKSDSSLAIDWLSKNRFHTHLAVLGGEATLHPDFKKIIESLHQIYKITVTTNLFSGLYRDMDGFVSWAKDNPIRWNTSYHPGEGMDADVFIDRIRKMRSAGLNVDQVASVDTDKLDDVLIKKLLSSNIGWRLQYATLIGFNTGKGLKADPSGELLPKTDKDIRSYLPLQWSDFQKYINDDYPKYYEACSQKALQMVKCSTDRLIVGPDDHIYTCHANCYHQRKNLSLGHLKDNMDLIDKWKTGTPINCNVFGSCETCDVGCIKIKKMGENEWKQY